MIPYQIVVVTKFNSDKVSDIWKGEVYGEESAEYKDEQPT